MILIIAHGFLTDDADKLKIHLANCGLPQDIAGMTFKSDDKAPQFIVSGNFERLVEIRSEDPEAAVKIKDEIQKFCGANVEIIPSQFYTGQRFLYTY